MKPYRVSAVATVPAGPERVFDILADYRGEHPHILPKRWFTGLEVEQGGYGAGTVIRFGMRVAGRRREARAAITEPVPGRVLTETDLGNEGFVTTFTVVPAGTGAEVEIATDVPSRGGLLGSLERMLVTRFLKRVYAEELRLLQARATAPVAQS
jgi:hypothetical protein